jgi:predicted MPP superfamily phosphohydrolase/PKD repeat protein
MKIKLILIFLSSLIALFLATFSLANDNPVENYTLTINKIGSGTIVTNPAGIDCGDNCNTSYVNGTKVNITITGTDGWVPSAWNFSNIDNIETQICELGMLRNRSITGDISASCTITITQNINFSVTFERGGVLKVVKTGSGNVVSSLGDINCGCNCNTIILGNPQFITLVANPAPGGIFLGWEGDCSGNGDCILNTDQHHRNIIANFSSGGHYTITINKTGSGKVTSIPIGINCGKDCDESYSEGEKITLAALANNGATINSINFSGSCNNIAKQLIQLDFLRNHKPSILSIPLNIAETETITVNFSESTTPPEPEPDKWSFAIITDLHIGRGYDDYAESGYDDFVNENDYEYYLTERLRKTVNWINENKDNVDCNGEKCSIKFLVILGDIADTAEKSEFLKTKEILDGLDIPYIPILGNHDVWPYTTTEKAQTAVGEDYFEEFFQNKIISGGDFVINNLEIIRDEKNSDLKNFAFKYGDINFIALDFNSRQTNISNTNSGVSSEGVIYEDTENWLKEKLNEYGGNEKVIIFSHEPFAEPASKDLYLNGIVKIPWVSGNFSNEEINYIKTILNDYENISAGTQILGNFGGHIHGFEKIGKELDYIGQYLFTDLFFDANWEYPNINGTPVISTEALMVAGNEKDLSNKGIIRIVKINDGEIDYSTVEGKFPALNPSISWDIAIAANNLCLIFKAHPFTQRDYSVLWDFDDGETGSDIWQTHCYEYPGEYGVTLTLTDTETGQEEYIDKTIEVKTGGIIPKILQIADEAKGTLELISTEFGENLAEFGRTMTDNVLVKVKHSPSTPVGMFTTHFEEATGNIDMTQLVADFDLIQRKSVLYMPNWPTEIENQKILFIPSTGTGKVYICPHAASLQEVNENCQNKIILNLGETKNGITLSLINYEGKEYYAIYGITGTGGGEIGQENSENDLETQIAITEMIYGNADILSQATANVGDGTSPLLLSELKSATIDLESYYTEGKLNPGESKKLKIKFKFLETAGNEYQGRTANIKFKFEAF